MKPNKIIIRSQDAEILNKNMIDLSTVLNSVVLANLGINASNNYFYGSTAKLTHHLERILESPKKMLIRKVILPASMPTFNLGNNKLKCLSYKPGDVSQNVLFDIEMLIYAGGIEADRNVYTTYPELNTVLNSKFQAVNSNFSTTIDSQTGILTINSSDTNARVMVIEPNEKFGYLYPWGPIVDFSAPYGTVAPAPVQLSQTKNIYIRSNIETNNYLSDGDSKIAAVIPFTLDLKDVNSGTYAYVNNSDEFFDIQERDYDRIDIELLDDNKNLINLNNSDITIELEFKYE